MAVVRGGRATVLTDDSNAAPLWAGVSALAKELGVRAVQRSLRDADAAYAGAADADRGVEEARRGKIEEELELVSVPHGSGWRKEDGDEESLFRVARRADHWVAIERAGRSASGSWKTMRGRAMDELVAPLDVIFERPDRPYGTTGIGDGGNELGMGKVLDKVRLHIPKGEEIGCVVPADHLVVAGVSNWGGWALAAAVAIVDADRAAAARSAAAAEAEPLRYDVESVLPSDDAEGVLSDVMNDAGARDGISGAAGRSVDNLPFDVHLGILRSIREQLRTP
jgi:hypothetical protein